MEKHLALALDDTRLGLGIGLTLIALGAGGIKPCVSANVGDQFGKGNWFRVRTVYQIFYFSINFGSYFSEAQARGAVLGRSASCVHTPGSPVATSSSARTWASRAAHSSSGIPSWRA